jgi:hypothetical protein
MRLGLNFWRLAFQDDLLRNFFSFCSLVILYYICIQPGAGLRQYFIIPM